MVVWQVHESDTSTDVFALVQDLLAFKWLCVELRLPSHVGRTKLPVEVPSTLLRVEMVSWPVRSIGSSVGRGYQGRARLCNTRATSSGEQR